MSGLPPRPQASAPGTSNRSGGIGHPQAIPSGAYTAQPSGLSGGYGAWQVPSSSYAPAVNPAFAYLGAQGMPTPYQQYPAAYPYPAYNPYPYQSYGQSLFQQPTQTQNQPIHWQSQQHAPMYQQGAEPPNKRRRHDEPASSASGFDPAAWRNCSHPGCKFVGSGEKVEEHEGDRHLIFRNGPKVELSEEELRYAKHKGPPPPVFGTNINLHTEEDIDKWLAERRAKWPSSKRVQAKADERQQAIARGENPDKKRGRRAHDPAAQAEDWGRPDDAPGSRGPERGSGRGRGRGDRGGYERGRGGTERGRGRGRGIEDEGRSGRGRGRGSDRGGGGGEASYAQARDTGYAQHPAIPIPHGTAPNSSTSPLPQAKVESPDKPAPSALAGLNYSSSAHSSSLSESDDSSDSSSDISSDSEKEAIDVSEQVVSANRDEEVPPVKAVCRFWASNGRCRFGDKCREAHPPRSDSKQTHNAIAAPRKQPRQPPQPRINPFARPSLLGQLLAVPIQNTLSQLTQTIRFLVANNMLEHVELEPGQAEEVAQKANIITLIDDADVQTSSEAH